MIDLKQIVEALLFAADAPIQIDKLVEICGGPGGKLNAGRSQVRQAISDLTREYDEERRAFTITEIAGGWQMYCRPDYVAWARELHKGRVPARLSQAALETLAIIAYKQPIVRAEIEAIRGVDTSGVLSTLLRRNLVAIAGRAPGMGRALLYKTTTEFLRYFGLKTITDLPRLEEFAEVLGLAPGELQLTIEGAEHLEGVRAASVEDAEAAPVSHGEDLAGVGQTDRRQVVLTSPAGAYDQEAQVSADETQTRETELAETHGDEAQAIEIVAEKSDDGVAGVDTSPPGVHPIEDRKLIDPIDEA